MYLTTQICRADSICGVDLPPPSDPKFVVLWSSREPGWGDRRGFSLIFEGISWRYPLSLFIPYAYFGIFDQSTISTASIGFIKKRSGGHAGKSPLFIWARNGPLLRHT